MSRHYLIINEFGSIEHTATISDSLREEFDAGIRDIIDITNTRQPLILSVNGKANKTWDTWVPLNEYKEETIDDLSER